MTVLAAMAALLRMRLPRDDILVDQNLSTEAGTMHGVADIPRSRVGEGGRGGLRTDRDRRATTTSSCGSLILRKVPVIVVEPVKVVTSFCVCHTEH